ncbi:unnamed protein product, partial [Closterium sp. NIES-54]
MHSRLLVSGLPRSLPSLPRSPAPPCLPCVEGRQRAAPHSSELPPTTAPLQTLHMDVWGPALVGGTDQERYFVLVVDDYTRYTTVFPLRRKFSRDFPFLRLHSDRGGEFSSDLLAEFCQDKGIVQSFTLSASPQQNGIAERHIGLIMEVAHTSMIHAAAPHSLWPFAVRYAAHQVNLWPHVSEPETSPTLPLTGNVGNASMFRVRGALSLVRDAKEGKLSSRTLRYVFLSFPTDALPWQFYHPRSRRGPAPSGVSQVDPLPLVEPLEVSSDSSGPAQGGDPAADDMAATRRTPCLETPPGFPPRPSSPPPQPAAVDSGAKTADAEPGGAETKGEGSGGDATGGAATGGAGSWGATTGGADFGGPTSPSGGGAVGDPAGGPGAGQPPQPDLLETLSPQVIRTCLPGGTAGAGGTGGTAGARVAAGARGTRGTAGAGGAGATSRRGATSAGGVGPTSPGGTAGAGGAAGARGTGVGGAGAADPGGARIGGAGAAGAGGAVRAGGATGAAGSGGTGGTAGAGGAGAGGAGGTAGAGGAGGATKAAGSGGVGGTAGAGGARAGGAGPRGARIGGAGAAGAGGAVRAGGATRAAGSVGTGGTAGAGGAGAVGAGGTAGAGGTGGTGGAGAAGPGGAGGATGATGTGGAGGTTGARGLGAARASGAAGVGGAGGAAGVGGAAGAAGAGGAGAASAGGAGAAGTALRRLFFYPQTQSSLPPHDLVLRQALSLPSSTCLPLPLLCPPTDQSQPQLLPSSMLPAPAPHTESPMDAEKASWKSTGTYVDEVPPPGANIVSGMWIFRVKRPPGSPPVFKARYVARGFSQRQGVDYFQNFSPTPKMTTLRVLLHVAAQRDYELHSLDFSTAFLQGSLHEEIRLTTLAALGFAPSTADPSLFLCTDTLLSPFYILVYVDDLVFATADTAGLAHVKSELQKRHTCTDLGELRSYLGLQITRDRAQRTITLTQSYMVQQVLQRFDFTYSSPQATPL